jgi:hypothetical protein
MLLLARNIGDSARSIPSKGKGPKKKRMIVLFFERNKQSGVTFLHKILK